jgi:hypothetical protein
MIEPASPPSSITSSLREGLHVQAVGLEVSQAPSLMQSFEQRFPPFLPGCDNDARNWLGR